MNFENDEIRKDSLADATACDLYDPLPFGVCIIDRDLNVHAWNSTLSTWTGISKAVAFQTNLGARFPKLLTPYIQGRLEEVIDHGHSVVLSPSLHGQFLAVAKQAVRKDSDVMQKTQIRPVVGDRELAMVIIEDVTAQFQQTENLRRERRNLMSSETPLRSSHDELRDATEKAKAASLVKCDFLANMSHEIRTPMTAILGYTDILCDRSRDSKQVSILRTIKKNGDHLLEIINDILDLSKIEAGKMPSKVVRCSPTEVVADVISLLQVRADTKAIALSAEYDGPLPEAVFTDPNRLRQILFNIVGNAIKFTEIGSVRLTVKYLDHLTQGPRLQFSVTDTGVGICKEHVSLLFRPFAQVNTSTSRQLDGTGLGLAISKRMAELLGGDVTVESVLGQGSTFTLVIDPGDLTDVPTLSIEHLAKTKDQSPLPSTKAAKADNGRPLEGHRILLAEDGPDNQKLISFLLEKAGAKVVTAENGQVAYDRAMLSHSAETPFDVVLMDMQMPVLDGYAATRKLRSHEYRGPIIALTAHAMAEDRQKCLDAGCDEYDTKPINRERLISLILKHECQSTAPSESVQ